MDNITSSNPLSTTFNQTNFTSQTFDRFKEPSWFVPQAIEGILILLTLWMLLCLICRGIHHGNCSSQCDSESERKPYILYILIVACPVSLLIRLVASQVGLNIGYRTNSNALCENVYDIIDFTYFLAILNVYLFIWLRQWVFYSNKLMNVTYSKPLRVLSATSLLLLFLPGIGILVLNMLPVTHPSSPEGCLYVPTDANIDTLSNISIAILFATGQGILLGLFVYPLQRNRALFQGHRCCMTLCCPNNNHQYFNSRPFFGDQVVYTITNQDITSAQIHQENQSENIRLGTIEKRAQRSKTLHNRIVSILRRTIIGTAIAVITDVFVILTVFFLFPSGTTRRIDILMYDLNLFLDVALVINTVPGDILKSPLMSNRRGDTSFFGH